MTIKITALYRYPVKGLNAEALKTIMLLAGQTVPWDRAYALENGGNRFDAQAPKHMPKTRFLMLARHEKLAMLDTRFDPETKTLTIERGGRQVATGALDTPVGRSMIEQFFAAYMGDDAKGSPKIVHADNHSFSDVPDKCLSILNLASIAALERAIGKTVDPMRFRANIHVEGMEPWVENGWADKTFILGGVQCIGINPITRCPATNVDPESGERDMAIPAELLRRYDHQLMGLYARVETEGQIAVGDELVSLG